MSINETIDEIITHKKSLSRFGDGEFRLVIKERNIVFQNLSDSIADRLNEVLNSKLPNHLVAIPPSFVSVKDFKRSSRIHWLNFINLCGNQVSECMVDKNYFFGNAFISRFYMIYKNKNKSENTVANLKKIWNQKDVLIVEGEYSRLGVGNDLFNNVNSLQRIICPSKDAFKDYKSILSISKKYGKDKLILIALGPTASILAYDLAKLNYWAIDIGHIDVEYMWMLQKAQNKISIKGRFVAEASSNEDFEIADKDKLIYEESILHHI